MSVKRDRDFYKRIGAMGGRATVERHGRKHMSEIGRKGQIVTTSRYFLGKEKLHHAWLISAGAHAYWQATGLPMKYDVNGQPIWPQEKPTHSAATTAPGQRSLFEDKLIEELESLPF